MLLYTVLIHCRNLDEGRKALGIFMAMGLKHSKNESPETVCPHCGETIPPKYLTEFIMSAKVDQLTTATEIVSIALLQRLDAGIKFNHKITKE